MKPEPLKGKVGEFSVKDIKVTIMNDDDKLVLARDVRNAVEWAKEKSLIELPLDYTRAQMWNILDKAFEDVMK